MPKKGRRVRPINFNVPSKPVYTDPKIKKSEMLDQLHKLDEERGKINEKLYNGHYEDDTTEVLYEWKHDTEKYRLVVIRTLHSTHGLGIQKWDKSDKAWQNYDHDEYSGYYTSDYHKPLIDKLKSMFTSPINVSS